MDFAVTRDHPHRMVKIKMHRLRRRMTQAKLAELVGVEQGYISRLERGLQEPSADVLKRLAEALSVSRADLYERDGLEARIMAIFEEIPEDRKEEAVELLEDMMRVFRRN